MVVDVVEDVEEAVVLVEELVEAVVEVVVEVVVEEVVDVVVEVVEVVELVVDAVAVVEVVLVLELVVEVVVGPKKNSMLVVELNGRSSRAISRPLLQSRFSSCGEVVMLFEAIRFPPPISSRRRIPPQELEPVPVSLILYGLRPTCHVPVGLILIPGPASLYGPVPEQLE